MFSIVNCSHCGRRFFMKSRLKGKKLKLDSSASFGPLCPDCFHTVNEIMDAFQKAGKKRKLEKGWGWKEFIEENKWILK